MKGGGRKFFQPMLYEGIDQLCFHCGVIGHVKDDCGELKMGRSHGAGKKSVEKACEAQIEAAAKGGVEVMQNVVCEEVLGGGGVFNSGKVVVAQGGCSSLSGGILSGGGVKASEKNPVVEKCREDKGYGDWTLVQRRKPQKPKVQPAANSGSSKGEVVGKEKDCVSKVGGKEGEVSGEGIMRFAASEKGEVVKKKVEIIGSAEKPFRVYSRGGGSSLEKVGAGFRKVRRSFGGENALRRPKSLVHGEGDSEGAAGLDSGLRGLAASVVVEFEGDRDPMAIVEREEAVRKRRRGEIVVDSGGDASPLVS